MSDHLHGSTSRPSTRGSAILALILPVLAGILFYGIDVLTGADLFFTHDTGCSDLWHVHVPFKHYYANAIANGELPLWCSEMGTGFPLHAEGQVGALYPPNIALFLLLPFPVALNASILLHVWLAGFFTGLLARQLGANRTGVAIAAVVLPLSGFFVTHLKHVNMTAAAAWCPLVFLLLEMQVKRRRYWHLGALGIVFGLMFLAGHPQIPYCTIVVANLYLPLRAVLAWWKVSRRIRLFGDVLKLMAGAWASMLVGGLIGGAQLVPTYELVRTGPRAGGLTWEESSHWDLPPRMLLTFVLPKLYGDPGRLEDVDEPRPAASSPRADPLRGFRPPEGVHTFFWECTAYLGLLPLAFFLLAAAVGLPRGLRFFLPALTLLCVLLALGRYGGLCRILYLVLPGFASFRFHDRFLLFVAILVAVGSALGITWAMRALERRIGSAYATGVGILCVLAAFFDLLVALGDHNPTIRASTWLTAPRTVQRILQEERGATPPARYGDIDPERRVFINSYLRARGWKGDLAAYDAARQLASANVNVLYRAPNVTLYSQLLPRWMNYVSLAFQVGRVPPDMPFGKRIASLFNVKYAVTPLPDLDRVPGITPLETVTDDDYVEDGSGRRFGICLYRNEDAMPRAFLVRVAVPVEEEATGVRPAAIPTAADMKVFLRLNEPSFDARREVLLTVEGGERVVLGSDGSDVPCGTVEIREYAPRRVRLDVRATRDCWLFLSDTYYPGWDASVDGESTRIFRANLAGRAVRIPRGAHEAIFEYRPWSLVIGGILSVIGLATALAALLSAVLGRRSTGGHRNAGQPARAREDSLPLSRGRDTWPPG